MLWILPVYWGLCDSAPCRKGGSIPPKFLQAAMTSPDLSSWSAGIVSMFLIVQENLFWVQGMYIWPYLSNCSEVLTSLLPCTLQPKLSLSLPYIMWKCFPGILPYSCVTAHTCLHTRLLKPSSQFAWISLWKCFLWKQRLTSLSDYRTSGRSLQLPL